MGTQRADGSCSSHFPPLRCLEDLSFETTLRHFCRHDIETSLFLTPNVHFLTSFIDENHINVVFFNQSLVTAENRLDATTIILYCEENLKWYFLDSRAAVFFFTHLQITWLWVSRSSFIFPLKYLNPPHNAKTHDQTDRGRGRRFRRHRTGKFN